MGDRLGNGRDATIAGRHLAVVGVAQGAAAAEEVRCFQCSELVGSTGVEVWPGQWWCRPHGEAEFERLTAACHLCGGLIDPAGQRLGPDSWRCARCAQWQANVDQMGGGRR